jgi:hypothetical protein
MPLDWRLFLVAAPFALISSGAQAATFRADVKDSTVTIYSTATKPEICSVSVVFYYTEKSDLRKPGANYCKGAIIKVGKNLEVCSIKDDLLVDATIPGEVRVENCQPYTPAATDRPAKKKK